jgi:hypothetical protein
MTWKAYGLFAGAALVLARYASAADDTDPAELQTERVAHALSEHQDADSRAAAALLRVAQSRKTVSLALLDSAAQAAPDRADIAWLHLQACVALEDCDPRPLEDQFRNLDPGNAVASFGSLSRATLAGDEAAIDQSLAAIAHARYARLYWTTLQSRLAPVLAGTREITSSDAIVRVIGALAVVAIPSFKSISEGCKGAVLDRDERRDVCRAVSGTLQRSDTYLVEMIGISIALRAWPPDSTEHRAALEARRVCEYRMHVVNDIDAHRPAFARADSYLRQLGKSSGEQDLFVAQIIAARRGPNPPDGWTEDRAR